ncbi:MAG TPA: FAD-dependent oxidoreductase [Lachnospiraceae bacterium]|jgi:NAD(P)H-nitrite reductase large subunit|nr:FAD-dependent oxidoreductase [Lachnospiraceae bacterium]
MKYVIIGSSAAGINAIRELRKYDKEGEIILVSKDEHIYSRCILHQYLAGERTLERLNFAEPDFDKVYNVKWMRGREAIGLRPADHILVLDGNEELGYDKLLVATGSHTFIPPIKGLSEADNYIGFRNIDDIEVLKEVPKYAKNIIVLGSGLIGIDCATGYLHMGVKVTLVDFAGWLLNRQLDERAAKTYIDAFKENGVDQYYGVGVNEVHVDDNHKIYEIVLSDGTVLPCDYFIVTAGVRSNVEFLKDSGLELSRFGLVYNEFGQTSDPDVYGAGDVSGQSPIWPVAVKEGMVAAANMAGHREKMTDFFASKSTMSFLGIHTMSLGIVTPPDDTYRVDTYDKNGVYKKVVSKDGVITGALLQGDLAYGGVLQQMIARKIDVRKVKKPLFEIDYSDFFHERANLEFAYEL